MVDGLRIFWSFTIPRRQALDPLSQPSLSPTCSSNSPVADASSELTVTVASTVV